MSRVVWRRCVACGSIKPRTDLVRVARGRDGQLGLGEGGRGAYVCRSAECIKESIRRKRLAAPLRVSQSSVDWETVERRLLEMIEDS